MTAAGAGRRSGEGRVRTLSRFASPYRRRALVAMFTLIVATITSVAGPLVAKEVIDSGIRPGRYEIVVLWVCVYLAVALAGWMATAAQSLDLGFFERTPAGVLISRLTNDIEAMNSMVTDGPTTLVQNTLTLLGSAVVLLVLDWRLALATLTVFPVMAVGTAIFRRYSARVSEEL